MTIIAARSAMSGMIGGAMRDDYVNAVLFPVPVNAA
jgi:hypothetical protein